jgi:3-oxoacyl-[acyl-carrier protein] reductase
MDLGLAERTALVCASTSGLGLATARALCEDGARVVVTSRSSERAEEVAAALPNAVGIGCDLVAADGAARLFGESTKRVGKIDILVLNGPGPAPGTAADVDDAGVDSAVSALVTPQVRLVRSVLPAMQGQRWGRILSISSTSVVAPIANLALSNLGRAALAGYLKTLASEVASQGITVNSLLPGRIATPVHARSMKRPRHNQASHSPTSSNPQPVRFPPAGMESPMSSAPWPPSCAARERPT